MYIRRQAGKALLATAPWQPTSAGGTNCKASRVHWNEFITSSGSVLRPQLFTIGTHDANQATYSRLLVRYVDDIQTSVLVWYHVSPSSS